MKYNEEMLDNNVLKVKKVIFKDSEEKVGLILPHYLFSSISTTAFKMITLDGHSKNYSISTIKEIKNTRVCNKDIKNALDKVMDIAKEWNKVNYNLIKNTKGYSDIRLNDAINRLNNEVQNLSNVYNEVHKEKIEKKSIKKEKQLKKEQELKDKEAKRLKREENKRLKEEEKEKQKQLKVIEKNKIINPKFINNGFIVFNGIDETIYPDEYSKTYSIEIYLKSEEELQNIKNVVGMVNINRTNKYDAKLIVRPKFRIYEGNLIELENIFGQSYIKDKFVISHYEDRTDEDWTVSIDIPSFTYSISDDDINETHLHLGSLQERNSEYISFLRYLDYLKHLKWIA